MSSVLYEPSAAEWAWAAGFYEGEGNFRPRRRGQEPVLLLADGQA
jgi:hypothetical protein